MSNTVGSPARNIFAEQLALLLAKHSKELSNLYTLKSFYIMIPPNKVTRLKRSLEHDFTATLNANELEMLCEEIPLDRKSDLPLLRAALLAEAVHRLIANRLKAEIDPQDSDALYAAAQASYRLGQITFQLLTCNDPFQMQYASQQLLDGVRSTEWLVHAEQDALRGDIIGIERDSKQNDVAIEDALEPAIETYQQGILWQEVARDTADEQLCQGYQALAASLLRQARTLVAFPPSVAEHTAQQSEWLEIIEEALRDGGFSAGDMNES